MLYCYLAIISDAQAQEELIQMYSDSYEIRLRK